MDVVGDEQMKCSVRQCKMFKGKLKACLKCEQDEWHDENIKKYDEEYGVEDKLYE